MRLRSASCGMGTAQQPWRPSKHRAKRDGADVSTAPASCRHDSYITSHHRRLSSGTRQMGTEGLYGGAASALIHRVSGIGVLEGMLAAAGAPRLRRIRAKSRRSWTWRRDRRTKCRCWCRSASLDARSRPPLVSPPSLVNFWRALAMLPLISCQPEIGGLLSYEEVMHRVPLYGLGLIGRLSVGILGMRDARCCWAGKTTLDGRIRRWARRHTRRVPLARLVEKISIGALILRVERYLLARWRAETGSELAVHLEAVVRLLVVLYLVGRPRQQVVRHVHDPGVPELRALPAILSLRNSANMN